MKPSKPAPLVATVVVVLSSLFLVPETSRADGLTPTHYVSLSGGNVPPYDTTLTAALDIQSAIDAASAGDIVIVADGNYSTGRRIAAGEFLESRIVIDKAITVQSENGPASAIIEGALGIGPGGLGVGGEPPGYGAVRCARISNGGTLRGFTLSGGATIGHLSAPPQDNSGGGVYIQGDGTLADCVVKDCRANVFGGGVFNDGTGVTRVEDCVIDNNQTIFVSFASGAGFYLASATVLRCEVTNNFHVGPSGNGGGGYLRENSAISETSFSGNSASSGAGLYAFGTFDILDCSFNLNTAARAGGGIFMNIDGSASNSEVTVSGCQFTSNTASDGEGGGAYVQSLRPTFERCIFRGNSSGETGGGLSCQQDPCVIANTLFSGNVATVDAGGAAISSGEIRSCTITANTSGGEGGGVTGKSNTDAIACINTIIYDNRAGGDVNSRSSSIAQLQAGGSFSFRNCIIDNSGGSNAWSFAAGYDDLGNNIDLPPYFLVPLSPPTLPTSPSTSGNFRLTHANSIAVDAGDGTGIDPLAVDLDGIPRVHGPAVDIGAYESMSEFESWAITAGLEPGVNAGLTNDPNKDGRPNCEHFALNTDPLGNGGDEGRRRITAPALVLDGEDLVVQPFTYTFPVRKGLVFSTDAQPEALDASVRYRIVGDSDLRPPLGDLVVREVVPAMSAGMPVLDDQDTVPGADWEYRTFEIVMPELPPGTPRPPAYMWLEVTDVSGP